MRRWKLYLSALCCALALTACGGQADASRERGIESGETSSVSAAEAAADGSAETEPEAVQSDSQAADSAGENAEAEPTEVQSDSQAAVSAGESTETGSRILIAYFTWADNTVVEDQDASLQSALSHYESMGDAEQYGADAISSASLLVPGNAARMAEWIQQEVGGDLFSIVVQDPYPSDYDECMDRAADEKAENARPALADHVENFEDYDIIFLGFPNWWYTLPMPVLTFVEEYDFSGKTVVPFCTHGTGGLSATIRDLESALPDSAEVLEPIGVYRADILEAQPQIQEWLEGLGF